MFTAFCFSLGELLITHTLLHQSGIHNCCHVLSLSLYAFICQMFLWIILQFPLKWWICVTEYTTVESMLSIHLYIYSLCWLSVLMLSLFLLPIISDSFGISFPTSSHQLIHFVSSWISHTYIKLDLLHTWLIMLLGPAHTHTHTHTCTHSRVHALTHAYTHTHVTP